jgi:hypothetical protein
MGIPAECAFTSHSCLSWYLQKRVTVGVAVEVALEVGNGLRDSEEQERKERLSGMLALEYRLLKPLRS